MTEPDRIELMAANCGGSRADGPLRSTGNPIDAIDQSYQRGAADQRVHLVAKLTALRDEILHSHLRDGANVGRHAAESVARLIAELETP